MDRRDFLEKTTKGAAAIACVACLGACATDPMAPGQPVDFTLDISQAGGGVLQTTGGSLVNQGILVIRTASGFTALNAACTHEGNQVAYRSSSNDVFCNRHGSVFALSGSVQTGPARTNLTTYKTTLTGNQLRVTS